MATKTGTIESIARTGKSIKVDGAWYGAFAKTQLGSAGVGDNVTFTYTSVEKDGTTYNNIKGNVTVAAGGAAPSPAAPKSAAPASFGRSSLTFPVPPLDGQRVIVRQNALAHATKLLVDGYNCKEAITDGDDSELCNRIIAAARTFEAYICGDLDIEEAMKED